MLNFEWDEGKNRANRKKHGVWFEEAVQVLDDTNAILFFDREHSAREDRYLLLGMSATGRILVVVHAECVSDRLIRIISARHGTKQEIKQYEKGI